MAAALVAAFFLYRHFDPASHPIYPKCPFFGLTNLHCPGCGSQRAVHHLANGEWHHAANDNVLIYFGLLAVVYNLVIRTQNHLRPQKPWSNLLHRAWVSWGIFVLVVSFWIFRNIPVSPFDWLAPG